MLEKELQAEEANVDIDDVQKQIKDLIETNDIVVYSKSYCPYCRQAKMMLKSIPGVDGSDRYKVIEMDDGKHLGWQTQVSEIAKAYQNCDTGGNCEHNNTRSVPQIFIHQQYVGGADDLTDLYTSGKIFTMLKTGIASETQN